MPGVLAQRRAKPAWQQILDAADAAGATAVYDPDNPDTWTLRDNAGTKYYSEISDGLGNWAAMGQDTDSRQWQQTTTATGRFAGLGNGTSTYMVLGDTAQALETPYTIMTWLKSDDLSATRILLSALVVGANSSTSSLIGLVSGYRNAFNGNSANFGEGTTEPELWTLRFSVSPYQRVNGVQIASGSVGNRIGDRINWGRGQGFSANNWWDGLVGPLIFWDAGVAAPTALEDLIIDLWGPAA
jgi:hypothetical protein